MTELLFESITGPKSGEGSEWWKLRADGFTNGVALSDEPSAGTFYIDNEFVTTENFQIGSDVERIVFPSVNVKFDRIEISNDYPEIDPDSYDDNDIKNLVFDVAETGINFSTSIESLEVPDTGENTESFTRQEETEGPFDFPSDVSDSDLIYDQAFADGYYVGTDLSKVPTFSDGIVEIQHGGTFDLNELPDSSDKSLAPIYEDLRDIGLFTFDNTYTFEFDLNTITNVTESTPTLLYMNKYFK